MKRTIYFILIISIIDLSFTYSQNSSFKITSVGVNTSYILKNNQPLYKIQDNNIYDYNSNKLLYKIDRNNGKISLIGTNLNVELESFLMDEKIYISSPTTNQVVSTIQPNENSKGLIVRNNNSNTYQSIEKGYDGSVNISSFGTDKSTTQQVTEMYENYNNYGTNDQNAIQAADLLNSKNNYASTNVYKSKKSNDNLLNSQGNIYSPPQRQSYYNPDLVASASAAAPKFVDYGKAFSDGFNKTNDAMAQVFAQMQEQYNSPEAVARREERINNAIKSINEFPRTFNRTLFNKNKKYFVVLDVLGNSNFRKFHFNKVKKYLSKYKIKNITIVPSHLNPSSDSSIFLDIYDNIYFNEVIGLNFIDNNGNLIYSSISTGGNYNKCYDELFDELSKNFNIQKKGSKVAKIWNSL